MAGTCTGTINVTIPCVDTTWTCSEDRLEHSNCGNTRTTTPCNLAIDALEMIAGTRPVDLRYDVNNNGFIDTGDVTLLQGGTPLLAYREANLVSCSFVNPNVNMGVAIVINTVINKGSLSEGYKYRITDGVYNTHTLGFIVDAGIGDISHSLSYTPLTSGSRTLTISLVRD